MNHALQVYLEAAEYRALRNWAANRGWTMSQTVRVALRALVRPKATGDALLAGSGMIEGLPADLSARVDDYLATTFVAERPVSYGTKRTRHPRKRIRR